MQVYIGKCKQFSKSLIFSENVTGLPIEYKIPSGNCFVKMNSVWEILFTFAYSKNSNNESVYSRS